MKELKIAIIGSGIAGLSAAWLLGREHQVTLFERHSRPGMGAFNLNYEDSGVEARIDVPLRAFNTCYYRNLIKLYQEAGVDIQRTDHSASYATANLNQTYFGYKYVGWGNRALPILTGLNKISFKSLSIVKDAARFLLTAKKDLKSGYTDDKTFIEYLQAKKFSEPFIYEIMLPSFAAICTCSYAAVEQYPAEIIVEFMASGLLFNGIWRARKGADDAIERLLTHCAEIHCNSAVSKVFKRDGLVVVQEENGTEQVFDHVIVAAQANQAHRLLAEDESTAVDLLKLIPYEKSEVVVHSDMSLIPKQQADRSPVNFLVDRRAHSPMASIWLNKIYPSLEKTSPLFQTWNPLLEPAPETILGRSEFERPTVNLQSLSAIKKLNQLHRQDDRQIWYCGSYAMPGIPLLESAVQSAMSIAEKLQSPAPWASA